MTSGNVVKASLCVAMLVSACPQAVGQQQPLAKPLAEMAARESNVRLVVTLAAALLVLMIVHMTVVLLRERRGGKVYTADYFIKRRKKTIEWQKERQRKSSEEAIKTGSGLKPVYVASEESGQEEIDFCVNRLNERDKRPAQDGRILQVGKRLFQAFEDRQAALCRQAHREDKGFESHRCGDSGKNERICEDNPQSSEKRLFRVMVFAHRQRGIGCGYVHDQLA